MFGTLLEDRPRETVRIQTPLDRKFQMRDKAYPQITTGAYEHLFAPQWRSPSRQRVNDLPPLRVMHFNDGLKYLNSLQYGIGLRITYLG